MLSMVECIRAGENVSDFVVGRFNDFRLQKTGALLFKRIGTMFSTCIKTLAGERKLEVSFGRFLQHDNVTIEEMSKTLAEKTNLNCKSRKHVLAIQDTVESTYPTQWDKKHLFGTGAHPSVKSILAHPSIIVDAFNKDILGIGSIKLWTRKDKELIPKHLRSIEEKESIRWIEIAEETKKNITHGAIITHITDREGDIYELLSRIPDERNHFIVRSKSDRILLDGYHLSEHMAEVAIAGKYEINLPAITGVRAERVAKVTIKFSKVDLTTNTPESKNTKEHLELTCIEIAEIGGFSSGVAPVFWRLLTTHDVTNTEEAKQIAIWYTWRWIIEQLFRTMKKKGFKIEESQIETPDSLMKLFLLGLAAAVQVLCLVYARDGKSNRPALEIFSKEELIVLLLMLKKVEGKTLKQKNPHKRNTLSWAAWIIARLGSWYPGASHPPGPITMFKGLKRFNTIFEAWEILKKDTCIG